MHDGSLLLSQSKYILDLLTRVNMSTAKCQPTPMASGTHLIHSSTDLFDQSQLYRSTVGALQYICITHPDLTFVVNKVGQFMHSPTNDH